MHRTWADTVQAHRSSVRDAVLDGAADLVIKHGLTGLTMAGIAEASGIGRATLYRYFPDVDAVLAAWHQRQVSTHVAHLHAALAKHADPADQLRAFLTTYAHLAGRHGGPDGDSAAALHRRPHTRKAADQVTDLLAEVLRNTTHTGAVRDDVPPAELAAYCLHALRAVGPDTPITAVGRLVRITLDALRPPP